MEPITVTIPQYEELSDDNSLKTYTCYTVRVVLSKRELLWDLPKRYSSFSNLHVALKDRYPEVEEYDFPNKSMFNTFSEFTKERRRAGFEGFLQLLVKFDPLPIEVEEFLEYDNHALVNESKPTFFAATKAPVTSCPPVSSSRSGTKSTSAPSTGADSVRRRNSTEGYASPLISSTTAQSSTETKQAPEVINGDFSNTVLKEMLSNKALQMEMIPILLMTIAFVCAIYLACIYVGLVDVSSSTPGE